MLITNKAAPVAKDICVLDIRVLSLLTCTAAGAIVKKAGRLSYGSLLNWLPPLVTSLTPAQPSPGGSRAQYLNQSSSVQIGAPSTASEKNSIGE